MKRVLALLLLLAICLSSVLLFSSCGKKKKGSANGNNLFSSEGLLLVERNDKYGYIDKTGKEVIPCKYYYATEFINGYAVTQEKKDDSYYYIKPDGTRLSETPYYRAGSFDNQGRALVLKSENGKPQLIDKDGKTIFSAKSIYSGQNGQYLFKDDSDLWGVVDKNGKVLLSARYDDLDFVYSINSAEDYYNDEETVLTDRLIAQRKSSSGTTYYLIDLKGNELYTAQKGYSIYPGCVNGTFVSISPDEGEGKEQYNAAFTLFNRAGKEIATVEGEMEIYGFSSVGLLVMFYKNYKESDDTYYKVIDWSGNVLIDFKDKEYDAEDDGFWWNGEMIFEANEKPWKSGVMNAKTGEIMIPMEYDYLSYDGFDGNGLLIGKKEEDGAFVVLNRKGATVFSIECDDLDILSYKSPYYCAEYEQGDNISCELLDTKGNTVHSFGTRFRPRAYYDDGFIVCRVYEDGEPAGYTIFNSKFEQVSTTIYDSIGY